jgi:hypothetical protein
MSKVSTTALSRRRLEAEGYMVALVERRIPGCYISQDLWGFADLLACHPDKSGSLLIQVTTTSHQADRLAKAVSQPALRIWLAANNSFEVHGWLKSRKTKRWELTRRVVTAADVAVLALEPAATATQPSSDRGPRP